MASRDQLVESRRQDIVEGPRSGPERGQGRAGLGELIVAVRAAVQRHADWPGTAISIHAHGTDVGRVGSSGRRHYELPVHAASSE